MVFKLKVIKPCCQLWVKLWSSVEPRMQSTLRQEETMTRCASCLQLAFKLSGLRDSVNISNDQFTFSSVSLGPKRQSSWVFCYPLHFALWPGRSHDFGSLLALLLVMISLQSLSPRGQCWFILYLGIEKESFHYKAQNLISYFWNFPCIIVLQTPVLLTASEETDIYVS